MASDWHVSKDRQQAGPFTSAELRTMVSYGQLGPNDFVWKEGMQDWVPASKIKGLFATVPVTAEPRRTTIGNEELAGSSLQTRVATVLGSWRKLGTPAKTGIAAGCAGILLVASFVGLVSALQGRNRSDIELAKRAKDAKPVAPVAVVEPDVVVMATHETASLTLLFIGNGNESEGDSMTLVFYQTDGSHLLKSQHPEWFEKSGELPAIIRRLDAGTKLRSLKVKNVCTNSFCPVHFVEVLAGPHKGTRGWIADSEILHN